MGRTVDIGEAHAHFSKLVAEAATGQEIVITNAGIPVAKLVAYTPPPRLPGGWEGRVWMAPDFDDLPPDLLASFEGD